MGDVSGADLRLSSYDFPLPEERIAQRPVEPRHAARLLAVDPPGKGPAPHARHRSVWDLQQELRPGDLLVVNDTRVLRARLEARRPTGGAVELLVLEPWQPPPATGVSGVQVSGAQASGVAAGPGRWLCLAKPAKKLKAGDGLQVVADGQPPLAVQVLPPAAASCSFQRSAAMRRPWSPCWCATAPFPCRPTSTSIPPATTSATRPAMPPARGQWPPPPPACT